MQRQGGAVTDREPEGEALRFIQLLDTNSCKYINKTRVKTRIDHVICCLRACGKAIKFKCRSGSCAVEKKLINQLINKRRVPGITSWTSNLNGLREDRREIESPITPGKQHDARKTTRYLNLLEHTHFILTCIYGKLLYNERYL
jgi:hypothetical protein